ncbi:MAG TPA: YfhO family protein [Thermoanaerobaculia bacterium]|nr:YfhO family protein [Thermoanaerobaculia bacterium]
MNLLVYLAGAALLGLLVHFWRPALHWRWIAAYLLVAGLFFAAPLTTGALQAPTDIAYRWRPWSEMVEGGFEPANDLLSDIPLQMLPFRALARERLLRREAPLWVHELGTGQPLLGNGQSAPFSLFYLLTLPLPAPAALAVGAALKVFLSLLLMHALLLALGAGGAGAALAAVSYAFSVFSICWAFHPQGMAAAWVPGVILGLVLLRRGERGGVGGLVACGTGLACCGHPETLAHTALAAALVVVGLLVGKNGIRRPRFTAKLLAAALLTACLSAPVVLPLVEALPDGVREAMVARRPELIQPGPFEWRFVSVLVEPLAFGSPRDRNWRLDPDNFNELCSQYAGLLTLALALAGALALRGRVLAVVAAGGVALMAALGVTPILRLVTAIPFFEKAANARLRLFWVLAVAIAAGLSLEALPRWRSGRMKSVACLAVAGVALALDPPPPEPWQRAWWLAALAGAAISALALVLGSGKGDLGIRERFSWVAALMARVTAARSRRGWTVGGFPALAIALLALDLGLLNARFLPVVSSRFDLAPPPAIQFLISAQAADRAAGSWPCRVLAPEYGLMPGLGALYGLWDPRGNDPMQPARPALVVGRAFHRRFQLGQQINMSRRPYPIELLDYLGVRYLLTRHRVELFPPWEEVWDGQGGKVWRNAGALPLFLMPRSVSRTSDPERALAATLTNGDFARTAVVEVTEHGSPPPAGPGPAAPQQGEVGLRRLRANGFDLEVESRTGGLITSSVSFARGWKAEADGQPAAVLRVNAAFVGFEVAPGRHRVTVSYRPAGWVWGLRLFVLGVAICLAAALRPALWSRARGAHAREHGSGAGMSTTTWRSSR